VRRSLTLRIEVEHRFLRAAATGVPIGNLATYLLTGKSQLLPFQTGIPARLKHLDEPSIPAPQELDCYRLLIL
jgi:hypothetical protein